MHKTKAFYVKSLVLLAIALLVAEMFTGYTDYPFGSGIVTNIYIKAVPFPNHPFTEVDQSTIESAVLDSENWVFVIHYQIPGDPLTEKQNRVLERLNAHFGGAVRFLKLDLTKHSDLPLCQLIKEPSVVVYGLSRANSDRHKMTGFTTYGEPRGFSYHSLLTRIHRCLWNTSLKQDEPQKWSVNGALTTDDKAMATRRVPYWNWYQFDPDVEAQEIAEQQ